MTNRDLITGKWPDGVKYVILTKDKGEVKVFGEYKSLTKLAQRITDLLRKVGVKI